MSNRINPNRKTRRKATLKKEGISGAVQDFDAEHLFAAARLWILRADLGQILRLIIATRPYREVARELLKLQPRGQPPILSPSLLSLWAWVEAHKRQTGDGVDAACKA